MPLTAFSASKLAISSRVVVIVNRGDAETRARAYEVVERSLWEEGLLAVKFFVQFSKTRTTVD